LSGRCLVGKLGDGGGGGSRGGRNGDEHYTQHRDASAAYRPRSEAHGLHAQLNLLTLPNSLT